MFLSFRPLIVPKSKQHYATLFNMFLIFEFNIYSRLCCLNYTFASSYFAVALTNRPTTNIACHRMKYIADSRNKEVNKATHIGNRRVQQIVIDWSLLSKNTKNDTMLLLTLRPNDIQ